MDLLSLFFALTGIRDEHIAHAGTEGATRLDLWTKIFLVCQSESF